MKTSKILAIILALISLSLPACETHEEQPEVDCADGGEALDSEFLHCSLLITRVGRSLSSHPGYDLAAQSEGTSIAGGYQTPSGA